MNEWKGEYGLVKLTANHQEAIITMGFWPSVPSSCYMNCTMCKLLQKLTDKYTNKTFLKPTNHHGCCNKTFVLL